MEWTTTFEKLHDAGACEEGYRKLAKSLGGIKAYGRRKPIHLKTILESNGLSDALWCLRTIKGKDKEIRLFAVACAREVQHLMKDKRSIDALEVAERFANGEATDEGLAAALDAALDAAMAAARDAARAAAWAAAIAAAMAAARDAAWAAARDAAWAAAMAAARDAARKKQEEMFLEMVGE